MSKTRIVLASVSVDRNYLLTKHYYSLPSLGLGYLAAAIGNDHFDVKIIHTNTSGLDQDLDSVVKEVLASNPEIVGFYSLSESFTTVVKILKIVKESNPSIMTLVGGPHISALPETLVNYNWIDYAIRGEAEESLVKLLTSHERSSIPGLVTRDKINDLAFVQDINTLKFPARELFGPLANYRPSLLAYKQLPATGILTARGCSNRCVFCQSGKGTYPLRMHTPDYVIEEMSILKKDYGINELIIFDDTFLVNEERAREICERMIKENLKFSWSCNARVNNVNKSLLALLKKSGCWLIQFGIESGNQQILKRTHKGIILSKVEESCRLATKAGLTVKGYFIFGLPGETEQTLDETTRFMNRLPIHYVSINFMTPFPGTPMWDVSDECGSFDKLDYDKINYLSDTPPFIPTGLTKEILMTKQRQAYLGFYLSFKTIIRNLLAIDSIQDIKKLYAGFSVIISIIFSKFFARGKYDQEQTT